MSAGMRTQEHSRGRLHPITRKIGAQWGPRLCHMCMEDCGSPGLHLKSCADSKSRSLISKVRQ
jgi:hypothetical protein